MLFSTTLIFRALLQIDKLEADVKQRDELIATNHAAYAKQKKELKQAKEDLSEFEVMKARIIKLEACIRNNTEVQDATRDAERRIKGLMRDIESEKQRADGNYRALSSANASLVSAQVYERELVGAFVALRVEFVEAVGENPATKMPLKAGVEVMDG